MKSVIFEKIQNKSDYNHKIRVQNQKDCDIINK